MHAFVSLMYHNVVRQGEKYPELSPSVTSYFVDHATFAAQVTELCRLGRCIDLATVRAFYDPETSAFSHLPHSEPLVHITFDDGWQGAVDVAGPILESYGCSALLFVATGLVDCPHFVSRSLLRKLPVDTLQVGSHARTHRFLNRLHKDEIRDELQSSKSFLEDTVGYEVDTLSIPGGAVDGRVRQIAADVGYRLLFTSEIYANTRHVGPMRIGRIAIKATTTMDDFGRYVQHNLGREQLRRLLLGIPKRVLGLRGYERLRRRLLGAGQDQHDMVDLIAPRAPWHESPR
jgi:peptidoglycan/xylan/chitin deacetylase (PgdA/CDA1 family)